MEQYPEGINYNGYNVELCPPDEFDWYELSFMTVDGEWCEAPDLPYVSMVYKTDNGIYPSVWSDRGGDGLTRFSTNSKEEFDMLVKFMLDNGGEVAEVLPA